MTTTSQGFPKTDLIDSQFPWQEVSALAQQRCKDIEAQHPGLSASLLVQELSGIRIRKTNKDESVVMSGMFPFETSGATAVISVTDGNSCVEWATNMPTLENISNGFEKIKLQFHSLQPVPNTFPKQDDFFADFKTKVAEPLAKVSTEKKLELVRRDFEKVKAAAPAARSHGCRYQEVSIVEMFVNSHKRMRQQMTSLDRAVLAYVEKSNGEAVPTYVAFSRQGGFEYSEFSKNHWDKVTRAVELFPKMEPLPPGEYDIVVDGDWAGLIAHEAFGHGAEADMIEKNRSRATKFMGKKVGSELVTMCDGPTLEAMPGTFFFDHEGNLATTTTILENGVLKRPMTHNSSARRLGITPSSNGRRQSPLNKTYTRMTNTYFKSGSSTVATLMSELKDGLYLEFTSNGMEDPKGWGIQCQGQIAREVKNGKFTGKVFGPVCMTGYVPDLLASIRMVANDFESEGTGSCGKGHKEWVKVSSGGPHMLMRARLS